ncbi:heme peroxidase [Pluteus cervinus]|uniref:Heme peroxidase n=1 Tax=Pluteus cervinus TaxID=181527 RepID=A0ACD3AVE1_9AGAR|nr:heme peroxidase [Pluteus cervinus]
MKNIYHGRCNDNTRAAIRLAFHDAGTFSLALQSAGQPNGGADGSLLTDPDEVNRPENNGLQTIVGLLQPFPARYGVSPGDIIQVAGTLAVIACPGGPQIKTWVGRSPPANINPTGLLPDTHAAVPVLTARFADMGFGTRELMALIGSHSTARQRFVDPARAGQTLDTTVDIWDVRFYTETQNNITNPNVFHLPSDLAFSQHPTTQQDYNRFVGGDRQSNWAGDYQKAHEKMSLLGYNQNSLTDCTEFMPVAIDLEKIAPNGNKGDPTIPPAVIESAIDQTRSIWL